MRITRVNESKVNLNIEGVGSRGSPLHGCVWPTARTSRLMLRTRVLWFPPCVLQMGQDAAHSTPRGALHAARTPRLQVFDVVTCGCVAPGSIPAHSALVYDLSWSADGRVLASCSSDCTAKVWYLEAAADHVAATRGRRQPPPGVTLPFCTVLHHPSFVYSCQPHPRTRLRAGGTRPDAAPPPAPLVIATGCADGVVRLWGLRGDVDPAADPDGTAPLLQLAVGTRRGPGAAPSGVCAVLWDPSPEAEVGLGATIRTAGTSLHGSSWALDGASATSGGRHGLPDDGTTVLFTGPPLPLVCGTIDGMTHATAASSLGCGVELPWWASGGELDPRWAAGDGCGSVSSWGVNVSGLCCGAGGAVRRLATRSVGAAVTGLTTAGYTVKLAVVTKASR